MHQLGFPGQRHHGEICVRRVH